MSFQTEQNQCKLREEERERRRNEGVERGREGNKRGEAVLYINPVDLVTHAMSVARFP